MAKKTNLETNRSRANRFQAMKHNKLVTTLTNQRSLYVECAGKGTERFDPESHWLKKNLLSDWLGHGVRVQQSNYISRTL